MMSEWQRLQSVTKYMNATEEESERRKAAKKLARRLLTCCWDSMVIILSAGLGENEDSRAKKIVKFSQKHLKVGSNNSRRHTGQAALYSLSLEGLHAVSLPQKNEPHRAQCNVFSYMIKIGGHFEQLAATSTSSGKNTELVSTYLST